MANVGDSFLGVNRALGISTLLFVCVTAAHADLTLEQKIEGAAQKGSVVTRVKGDKFRLDLPAGKAGPVSTIVDIKSGDLITLVHDREIAITRTGEQVRQAQEARGKAGGGDPGKKTDAPKPRATNLTERVGEYEAEIYTLEVDGATETLWLVKDYPQFESIREHLQRVSKAPSAGVNRSATVDVASLPGMLVKRQKERDGQKLTMTLTKVNQNAIDDSVFEVPADFKVVSAPAAGAEGVQH